MKPTRKPAEKKVVVHNRGGGRSQPRTTRHAPPQPPACYQEALFDSEGNQLPLLPEELREGALRYTESRRRTGLGILRRYLNPTVTWPRGKDAVIEERIGHATGNITAIQSFARLLRAAGIELDLSEAGLQTLPLEFRMYFSTLGLMERSPSSCTRKALAVFQPFGLYSLLSLDPPLDRPAMLPHKTGKIEESQLRSFESLLPVLRDLGSRVIDQRVLVQVLATLHKLLEARATVAVSRAEENARAQERVRSMIPAHELGWTARGVEFRREKLRQLVDGLRKAEPGEWPISHIARLILASDADWLHPPCPKLFASYKHRHEDLEDLLKKDLKRSRKTIANTQTKRAVSHPLTDSKLTAG